jgi:hypothetical protein
MQHHQAEWRAGEVCGSIPSTCLAGGVLQGEQDLLQAEQQCNWIVAAVLVGSRHRLHPVHCARQSFRHI